MEIKILLAQIFIETKHADKRTSYLEFEFLSCAWLISSKYAEQKLKDFHSVYRN